MKGEWMFRSVLKIVTEKYGGKKIMDNEFLNLWMDMLAKAMDSFMRHAGTTWEQFSRLSMKKQKQLNNE